MTATPFQKARYQITGVPRYRGIPFIEALPRYPKSKMKLLTCTAKYPPRPTAAIRKSGEMVRAAELRNLADLRIPLPEYHTSAITLTLAIREPYVTHNPLNVADVRRRHEVATATDEQSQLVALQLAKSNAMGHLIISHTGGGKSTFLDGFLETYPQVIQHVSYHGRALICTQIPYLILRCPHDGSLKALCLQFFYEIDLRLGTEYLKQAIAIRNIAPMVMLMKHVAVAVSLALLAIDELQNLRVAAGAGAELMLALFSDILERVGVSLVVLATPAIHDVLGPNVRNVRKLTTVGDNVVEPLGPNDKRWIVYSDVYWGYSYTKKHGRLTSSIRRAWYNASGANRGFAAAVYFLAQLDAIGGRECVDELSFEHVSKTRMAFLQPAISALVSGDPDQQLRFDDLVLQEPYANLRALVNQPDPPVIDFPDQEFDDEATARPQRKKVPTAAKNVASKRASRREPATPRSAHPRSVVLPRKSPPIR
jgi:hypothetical protein